MDSPFTALPRQRPFGVDDAVLYESALGPWHTKSGGEMTVLFAPYELQLVPELKLGIRTFHTSGLAADTVGGKHFHRIKQEIISAPRGTVEFVLEDVYGKKRNVTLKHGSRGLYVPPYVMHTYTVLEDTELIGVSNTLYDHDNPDTHDTYEAETFQLLQKHYATSE
jgi:dTDP-4-dehydrorhamnose 3,5-epimerase-like enzyme